ncbi:catabolite repression sensor kinase for PhoB; alternative sensor for pho regulon [gamma proteobacterium HTCC5015]|nr:catabolite repression sensor kinase for PhoB; alternative sensor for pho regulon [gamma proteobacterium HTCC5015]
MGLGVRVFLVCFLLVGLGTSLFLNGVIEQLPSTVRQSSEEALVDTSHLLAELAAKDFDHGYGPDSEFYQALERYRERQLNANIWSRFKKTPSFVVYITDMQGVVVFHTDDSQVGQSYANWRDVALTIKGEYGARTTRLNEQDPTSSLMYVAAPLKVDGVQMGVLSVGQPTANFQPFLSLAKSHVWKRSAWVLLLSLVLGGLFSLWLSRSIGRLLDYVESVRKGERIAVPELKEPELNRLAKATAAMQEEIDGKHYVEEYIHSMTHEMKSPLSGIQGAVELLMEEDVDAQSKQRFLNNIHNESHRLKRLVDQLLSLASVEAQPSLSHIENLPVYTLISHEVEAKQWLAQKKSCRFTIDGDKSAHIKGERFLLQQVFSNVLDNAIDFADEDSAIHIDIEAGKNTLNIAVYNRGPHIPDYAKARLFERFYSLPRPSGVGKSSGLGLSFVAEVMRLHGARVQINNTEHGVVTELLFTA